MVRKIILQMLISVVMILTLTSAFVFTIVYINKGKPEKKDKLYEINATHGGLIQTIAHYLVKPILESALDRYIEKHGLTEYLEEITQQKEEDSINFYEITEGSGSKAFVAWKSYCKYIKFLIITQQHSLAKFLMLL